MHGVLFWYGSVALVAYTVQLHSLIGARALVAALCCGGSRIDVKESTVQEMD